MIKLLNEQFLDDLNKNEHLVELGNQNVCVREECFQNYWRSTQDELLCAAFIRFHLHKLFLKSLLIKHEFGELVVVCLNCNVEKCRLEIEVDILDL